MFVRLSYFLLLLPLWSSALDNTYFPSLPSSWSGTNVSAGGVISTGNNQSQNVNAGSNIAYQKKRWAFTSNDTFNFARTTGVGVTASRLFLQGQLQYNFAKKNYSFLESDYTDDRFDGYRYILNSIVGYGRRLINQPSFSWDIQGGPGIQRAAKQADEGGDEINNNVLINGSTQVNWQMSQNAAFSENLGLTSTQINTRTISTTAITANLISRFAMQLSFQAVHDSLPLAGKKPLNTITTLSLVYTLA